MALMMILSVVPFYASAEAVALTTDNVVTWPTTSGEIWFGQKLSDGIVLHAENALVTSDGTENGTVIPGTWSFADNDFVPTTSGSTARFTLVFTPEDQTAYTGFERVNGRECTCVVNKVTPVFVDEINDPVVATDVEQGAKLSTSTLSGGQMKNPYTNEIIDKAWKWSSGNTIVNSSGEYKANFAGGSGYNKVEAMIAVKVIGTMQETEIIAVDPVTVEYSASLKNGDLPITGAKAVIKGTDIEIPGTFSIKNPDSSNFLVGEYTRTVIFTPDDTENYIASEGKMSVTVTKGNYKLVNEDGEEVTVPEITLPYGTTFDINGRLGVTLKSMIKDRSALSGADVAYISFPDHDREEIAPVGTNTYTVRIYPSHEGNSSYKSTYYQFVLTIEPAVLELSLKSELDEENANIHYYYLAKKNYNDPAPKGTFTYYIDGELAAENVGMGYRVKIAPEKSGTHEIKIVYNPVENDPFIIEDINRTTNIKLLHKLSRGNLVMGGRPEEWYGDEVKLSAIVPEETFGGWKFTDANGNEVVLEDAVYEGQYVTFTMPDFDLTAEFIDKSASSDDSGNIDDIFGNLGDLTEGDSESKLVNIINNLIAFIRNIIEKITGFFRAIGDAS